MPAPIVPIAAAAVARLVAKHGMKQVQRALKAANKPAKGAKAAAARKRGKAYQSEVNENVAFKEAATRSRLTTTDAQRAKATKDAADMKMRSTIAKNRAKPLSPKQQRAQAQKSRRVGDGGSWANAPSGRTKFKTFNPALRQRKPKGKGK